MTTVTHTAYSIGNPAADDPDTVSFSTDDSTNPDAEADAAAFVAAIQSSMPDVHLEVQKQTITTTNYNGVLVDGAIVWS